MEQLKDSSNDSSQASAAMSPRKKSRLPFDRGPRPWMRGRIHQEAAWFFGGTGTALTSLVAATYGVSWMTFVTAVYAATLVGMLTVSSLYHRAPWRTEGTVAGWRRADHAMIAVFIAGSYGPVTLAAFGDAFWNNGGFLQLGGWWILIVSWVAALAAVLLNVVWIQHPRWLDALVYLSLGWIAVVAAVGYWNSLGPLVCSLLVFGGLVYSLGAVIYARKWPNPSERWFGFHEVFHALTIVAAGVHHIAIWLMLVAVPVL